MSHFENTRLGTARLGALRRLARRRDGSVAAEFAVVGSFLLMMLIGIADYTLPLWRTQQLSNAAWAGAAYAAVKGWNSANIITAATSATQFGGLTVSPVQSCGCPNTGSTGITAATCGTTCGTPLTGSPAAGTYVTVTATYTYTPLVPFLNSPSALSVSAVARIQ